MEVFFLKVGFESSEVGVAEAEDGGNTARQGDGNAAR